MPDSTPAEPRTRPRVLVVDDDADCVFVLATLLRQAGYEADTARTGWEALAVARQVRPDVVLLDLGLPGMSGYELAGLMKKHAAPPPFLIALPDLVPGRRAVQETTMGRFFEHDGERRIRCQGPVLGTPREQQRRNENDRRERERRVARYEEQWLSHGQLFDGDLGYLFDPRPEPSQE